VSVTARQLESFRAYLAEFGLASGSVDIYCHHVKRAYDKGSPIDRLKSRLAPKTKRLARAALRHWADHTEDNKLRLAVNKLRLPAPRRRAAKVPLARAILMDVRQEILDTFNAPMRSVLRLMSDRGFRDGDVLRLQRTEVMSALKRGKLVYEAKGGRFLEFTVLRTFKPWLEELAHYPKWGRVDELLCPRSKSSRARRAAAARKVQRALEQIGETLEIDGLHPHQLRRTYCVEYLRAQKGDNEALMKLAQHMQWANMQTAMEYVDHLRGAELDTIAETLFDKD